MGKCYLVILCNKPFLSHIQFPFLFHSFIKKVDIKFFFCFYEVLDLFWRLQVRLIVAPKEQSCHWPGWVMPDSWPVFVGAPCCLVCPSSFGSWWHHYWSWWQPDVETSISPSFQVNPVISPVPIGSMWNCISYGFISRPISVACWPLHYLCWWIFPCLCHWGAMQWKPHVASTNLLLWLWWWGIFPLYILNILWYHSLVC